MDNATLRYIEDVVDRRHRRAVRAHTLVRAVPPKPPTQGGPSR